MTPAHEFSRTFLGIWTWGVALFVLAPLFFVVAVSLTPLDYLSLPTTKFSLRWYEQLTGQQQFKVAAINSLIIAVEASITALLLGVLTALAVVRYRFPGRNGVRIVATSPLFIPMVMSGLAILIFFSMVGWRDQATRLYVAHCALTLPYVFRTVSASLSGFDMNQELAARNLGANPVKAFMLVTLPQLGPGLIAGAVFAFIVSFDNVGISIFLTGSQFSMLPVELFSYASYSNDPMAAAVSVAMIGFSMAAILLVERFFGLQRLMRS
jgi:putative spermidine/putrescine transport system permease protein